MASSGLSLPQPDTLLELDQEYTSILALLDAPAAIGRLAIQVPQLAGVETAFTGEVDGHGQMILHQPVNLSDGVEGLTAPMGASIGGKAFVARRSLWTSDYRSAQGISPHFKSQAQAEGLVAVIAVPMIYDGKVLGVLYAGNREKTHFADRTIQALENVAARMMTAQIVAERARHAAEVAVHEERRRLALDLHDSVGAMLFTLRAGIQRLSDEAQLDGEVRSRLTAIEQQAAQASAALRGSLRVLHAPPEQVALGVALRGHCRAFSERTGIPAQLITLSDLPGLPRAAIVALSDVAREALLNVEKHAHAHHVVVSVFALRDGVSVTISDDGTGLDADHVGSDGLGLASMSERIGRVGGTFDIRPNGDNGSGVTVQAWIPALLRWTFARSRQA
jgi:signal transduction histidine kinase